MIKAISINIPIRWRFDVNKSFIKTADNKAQPVAFNVLITFCIYEFVLNLSTILETIVTITNEGKTIAVVANSEPKIPFVVNPAKVAMFMPIGPGVIEDIAIIWVSCVTEYQ